MTDPIRQALDAFVPAFDSTEGDWQAILQAASLPASPTSNGRVAPVARRQVWKRRPSIRGTVALGLALIAVLALSVAWAAGAFDHPSPTALFTANPQGSMSLGAGLGRVWKQTVVTDSVRDLGSVDIPSVGPVALWHARTKQGGYCLGLRLPNGDWLGTGVSPLDAGGTIPGCFPVGVIDTGNNRLEWNENDIDASSVGGTTWRIRFGVITVPGAVKVTDLTTGQSTDAVDGNVFMLAIQAPIPSVAPYKSPLLHLVAYDQAGKVIASDRIGG
jgi:hypothetical protein